MKHKLIAVASDHAGFELNSTLLDTLRKRGIHIRTSGGGEKSDYPVCGERVQSGCFG